MSALTNSINRVFLGALLIAGGSGTLAAEDDFPGFKKLMTVEEFENTGLDKLSGKELDALTEWLIQYTAGDAQVLQATSEVREAKKNYEVRSRIVGDFSGWTGKTIFRLENGQVWKQRLSGRYPYRGPANPEVIINKNWAGFFKMTLVDVDKSIGVTQVVD
ncbi:hypothetical protein [Congregibacter litoralis]|uniref:Uncharacterized protein n=1 Tax=Congregibacter litoralis KT71 TaxID=314285 RepID=A4ABW0_9GAMM|nr:hypothetical protein [Congregibacter litoralis]EAQ96410.1 hypothetical protein KT71_05282 [Congregibacter litoralis KT71]